MDAKNEPKRVFMIDCSGHVDVTDHLLRVWLGPGHSYQDYRINARSLWEQLKSAEEGKIIPVGDLDLLPKMDKGVMIIYVFNAEEFEQELPYGFQLTLFCLREALIPFLKYC